MIAVYVQKALTLSENIKRTHDGLIDHFHAINVPAEYMRRPGMASTLGPSCLALALSTNLAQTCSSIRQMKAYMD